MVRTVATSGVGLDDLVDAVEAHRQWLGERGLRARRLRRAGQEVEAIALGALRARVGGLSGRDRIEVLAAEVVDGRTDPWSAADRLVAAVGESPGEDLSSTSR